MKRIKAKIKRAPAEMRLTPENRVVSKFDAESIAEFPVASREKMGVRVVDDCAEEHIM